MDTVQPTNETDTSMRATSFGAFQLLLRLAVGGVFLLAVWGKMQSPEVFQNSLTSLGAPGWFQRVIVPGLLGAELTVALSLILNFHVSSGWKIAIALAGLFLITQIYGFLWRGMSHCDCFGLLLRLSPPQSMLLDTGILGAVIWAAATQSGAPAGDAAPGVNDRRGKNRRAVIDILLLGSIAYVSLLVIPRAITAYAAGPVDAPHPAYHFGFVREGALVDHVFELDNNAGVAARVVGVERSCSCTSVHLSTTLVPPVGKALVSIEMRPADVGPFEADLWVTTRAAARLQRIRLWLVGTVLRQ